MNENCESKQKGGFASLKRALVYGLLSFLVVCLIGFVLVCFSIRAGVKEMSAEAVKEFPGDRVQALIAYVGSENHTLKKRNRAVWALGQIGDKRALPVLESYYTGGECDHDKNLCQRELKHAICGCKGGINLTAWLGR
jgi:hypothetical protein